MVTGGQFEKIKEVEFWSEMVRNAIENGRQNESCVLIWWWASESLVLLLFVEHNSDQYPENQYIEVYKCFS